MYINMGFSIMCLFKDLQEEVYPGVHPHADVSWDLEFMGTRSNFPTLVSFYTSSHPAATLTLPLLIIFWLNAPLPQFSLPPCSSYRLPSLLLNIPATPLADLTTFLLLFFAQSSFHALTSFLLNQLNCYPPPQKKNISVLPALNIPSQSCFCSAIITPASLNQLYHTYFICVWALIHKHI